jgi:hypothetical protein
VTADVTMKTFMSKDDLHSFEKLNHPFMQTLVKDIEAWSAVQQYNTVFLLFSQFSSAILPSVPSNECYLHGFYCYKFFSEIKIH